MRMWLLIGLLFVSRLASGQEIAAKLQPFVESHSLAGAVTLVASKDKVLAVDTVGFADIAAKTPMRADSLFWIASMTKPITATGLMVLVDEGKVRIDDPVEKFLPEFKGLMVAASPGQEGTVAAVHPITVKNVLNHTSGLLFKTSVEQPTIDLVPLRDAVLSYTKQPLLFQPDSKYLYSNAGINTAARIIEVVTGQSYEQFMQERFFTPLGMKDTTFWPNEEQLTRLAKSYKPNSAKDNLEPTVITALSLPLSDRRKRHAVSAGGLFSTAQDCGQFCRMVLRGGELDGRRYLSEATVKMMTSRHTGEHLKESYGLGWSVSPTTFGHGGAYATNMTVDTKHGLVTVFLVQHSGFSGDGGKAHGVFKQAAEDRFAK